MLNNKTILVTGGFGFIGSNFINLVKEKYPLSYIVNVDKATYAAINLPRDNASVFRDISKKELMDQIFGSYKPNIVVNFAAESHVDNSLKDPYTTIETNIKGTQVLLDMAVKYNVDLFVQISTDEVYGDLNDRDDGDYFFLDMSPKPSSPYSVSKLAADNLVDAYVRTYGLNAIVTRCSNNVGKGQDKSKFVPYVIGQIFNNEPINVYGDGLQERDWIPVDDHCLKIMNAIENSMENKFSKEARKYLFGTGNTTTNLEMIEKICYVMGEDFEWVKNNLIKFVDDRPGHDRKYRVWDSSMHIYSGKTVNDAINDLYLDMLKRRQVYGIKET